MHRFLAARRAENMVDRFVRPLRIPYGPYGFRMAGPIGLVYLDHGGIHVGDLPAQHLGESHRQRAQVVVVAVYERLRQHIGRGEGELERRASQWTNESVDERDPTRRVD